MITKTLKIMDIIIKLTYQYDAYFLNNLEHYEILDDHLNYDYTITSKTVQTIIFNDSLTSHILLKSKDDKVKAMYETSLDKKHITLYMLENAYLDPSEAEYVYLGMIFLRLAFDYQWIALHASTILYQDKAIAFSAPSHTGKSTHAALWTKYIKGCRILNDDKTMLSFKNNKIYAHGIPFSGANHLNINQKAELFAIVFLKQGESNKISKMDANEAVLHLSRNIYRPTNENIWLQVLDEINMIINQVAIYILEADISQEAVETVYNKIFKEITNDN